jgi:hypothetical protein
VHSSESSENFEHYFLPNRTIVFHYFSPGKATVRIEFLGELPQHPLIEEQWDNFSQELRYTADGIPYEVYFMEAATDVLDVPFPTLCEGCKAQQIGYDEDQGAFYPLTHSNSGERSFLQGEKKAQTASLADLAQHMRNKKCVLMVGTGLAAHAGVQTRGSFAKQLGIQGSEPVDGFVRQFLKDPMPLLQSFVERTEQGLFGEPTPVMYSLAQIAKQMNCPVWNSNFDQMLSKTGIEAVHLLGQEEDAILSALKDVEAIITVGLHRDPCGVLARFKSLHPEGVIFAIDLEQPPYLGEEDVWISGDLTDVIPDLEKYFQ